MTKYQKEIESLLFNYEKNLDKKLYKAYAHSLKEIKREIQPMMENIENLNYTQRQKLIKDVSLKLQIEQQLDYLNGYVTDNTYKFLNQTGEIAYNGLFYEFEQTEKLNTNFTMLPTKTIETIVQTPIEGLRFSERIQDGSVSALRSNFEEIFRIGFTKGHSYEKMAKRLSDAANSSYKRSMRIARTEGGRVQAVTRQMSQQDALELGIRTKKEWVSTLDGSTRDTHRKLDGQIREVDEYFEVNGHKALQPHLFGIPEEDIHCRCRSILILDGYDNKLRRDNKTKEVIKYKNYQDWADSKAPKKVKNKSKGDIIELGKDMSEFVGKENYINLRKSLNSLPDGKPKEAFRVLGKDVKFEKLKNDKRNFASGSRIKLTQDAFDGNELNLPLETVYHETGHALDSLGLIKVTGSGRFKTGLTKKVKFGRKTNEIDIEGKLLSSHPDYNLKQTIRDDLWKYVNGDVKSFDVLGKKPRKKAEKEIWLKEYSETSDSNKENMIKFIEKMKSNYSQVELGALSDVLESTGWAGKEYPLGSGHGKNYWKEFGHAEAEFFAHATGNLVNSKSNDLFLEIFPNAMKIHEKMLKDILKGG